MTASELLEPFFLSDDPEAVIAAAREVERASSGEVRTPERTNARTLKPERGGLLCARVFGPVEDHRCLCGAVEGRERAGEECERCGVLCGERRLREERWGHVALPWPVLHPVLLARVAERLGCRAKEAQLVLGFQANLNADGSVTRLRDAWQGAEHDRRDRGPGFVVEKAGAELLVTAIPVTPAAWRGGKRDAQDDAYVRVVNRRNRLARLLELSAPDIILENEYRLLQQRVDRAWTVVRAELTARRGRVVAPRDGRHAELLQAVLEQPREYGVRGVYADWLIEHGDPRGEFITLQLANADRVAMGKREAALLARHYAEWLAPLGDAVDYVVFRRGFLASCRAQKPALQHLGDPAWATVEHLNTCLPELVRQPVLRALSKLSTNARCLATLCAEGPLPQLSALALRIPRCPPRGHELMTANALPNVRELVVLHQSAAGTSDWSWLLGTPLARRLTQLTLGMVLERLDDLRIARWLPVFDAHPRLRRLALSYDKKKLVFELVRTGERIDLELTTTRALVERVCMMDDEPITPAIARALERLPRGLRVEAAANTWFGERFEALATTLKRRFRGAIAMPKLQT